MSNCCSEDDDDDKDSVDFDCNNNIGVQTFVDEEAKEEDDNDGVEQHFTEEQMHRENTDDRMPEMIRKQNGNRRSEAQNFQGSTVGATGDFEVRAPEWKANTAVTCQMVPSVFQPTIHKSTRMTNDHFVLDGMQKRKRSGNHHTSLKQVCLSTDATKDAPWEWGGS